MSISNWYSNRRSRVALQQGATLVAKANKHEEHCKQLTDEALQAGFKALANAPERDRIALGLALVREAAFRTKGLRPFDVQLLGGSVLLRGMLAEMRTGEGKTLTLVAPAALLALRGLGVHVVTANAYLAERDAEAMRPVYEALGLSVAVILEGQSLAEKKAAYLADVTYGVGSEFGFDYLKDHLATSAESRVQRALAFALVDEVDSILIDEARVPLIISGSAEDVSEMVFAIDSCVKSLSPSQDFTLDLKEKTAALTERGYAAVEAALVSMGAIPSAEALYAPAMLPWVKQLHSTVTAYAAYRRNKDYVVEDGEISLVDQGTGRKMIGRRLEGGLHEALEAKEGVAMRRGTETKATVTYQNYFGMYKLLGGLSGTALTDADEFSDIYGLEVVVVPTHRPVKRKDLEDLVYLTKFEKFSAAVAAAKERSSRGQPVLLGCATIRDADALSTLLTRADVPHETLTARDIAREAHIVANAGKWGAVTVATNVAGRGTDIALGGEQPSRDEYESNSSYEAATARWANARSAVLAAGGLFVIGTERNGLRRVDNQLAGRSGRQGDPGEVQFILSLEDDLLVAFSKARQLDLLRKAIARSGGVLAGSLVSKLVTTAQRLVEGNGYAARKSLMQFDSVLSDQRNAVYQLRDALLEGGALEHLKASARDAVLAWANRAFPEHVLWEELPLGQLKTEFAAKFGYNLPLLSWAKADLSPAQAREKLIALVQEQIPVELSENDARALVLATVDAAWVAHISALDELQKNVSLKTTATLNPVYQFHKDAFALFESFSSAIDLAIAASIFAKKNVSSQAAGILPKGEVSPSGKVRQAQLTRWVTRNEPCPCESGKRFKFCHGAFSRDFKLAA